MASIEHNGDGSAIVKLTNPVKFKGEEHSRVTIPPLTGKQMRKSPVRLGELPTLGELSEFAAIIAQPSGIFDELSWADAKQVGEAVLEMLGKSLSSGEPASAG